MKEWNKPEIWELDVKNTECYEVKCSGYQYSCPTGSINLGALIGWVLSWLSPPTPKKKKRWW